MSYEGKFLTVVGKIGQLAEVWRDGTCLGSGLAYLEPVFLREDQFQPTDLGVRRRETQVCYAQATLPLDPAPGTTLLKVGKDTYRVLSARERKLAGRRIFWVAYLEWREEEEQV